MQKTTQNAVVIKYKSKKNRNVVDKQELRL